MNMATTSPFLQIRRIEFQSDIREVMITCSLRQGEQLSETRFFISHTELNRIIGDLQERNDEVDVYELMDCYQISPDLMMYTLDFEEKPIQNTWIPEQIFNSAYRMVRA